jgi:hypothetical protein
VDSAESDSAVYPKYGAELSAITLSAEFDSLIRNSVCSKKQMQRGELVNCVRFN